MIHIQQLCPSSSVVPIEYADELPTHISIKKNKVILKTIAMYQDFKCLINHLNRWRNRDDINICSSSQISTLVNVLGHLALVLNRLIFGAYITDHGWLISGWNNYCRKDV